MNAFQLVSHSAIPRLWRGCVAIIALAFIATSARADSARLVVKNEGSTDVYVARVVTSNSALGSRSEGWFRVPAGQSTRVDWAGQASLYWFCFAKTDKSGQFGAFTPSFEQRGDLITSSNRQFVVRKASWFEAGLFKNLDYQATARPGFSKAPFPLCVDARPFLTDINYHRDLTFSVNPDEHDIVTPIGSKNLAEPIGELEPAHDMTAEEFVTGVAVAGAMYNALKELIEPKATQNHTAPPVSHQTTPQERRLQQRKNQEERERARQARARDLCDYLRRVFAAAHGGDLDAGAAVLTFVLSGFGGSDYVYDLAEKVKAATTPEGEVRDPDAFAVSGTRSPADIILTRLACWDSSFFLDVLLYELHGGKDGARVARMHRELLEHEGIDLRARAKALSKAAGYQDEPRAWLTESYKKVRVIDRQLATTLLPELRDPIIRETEGGKVLWAFADPSTDVLFGSAVQPVKTEKAKCAPKEWEVARKRLVTWWTEHVDQSAPLPSPAEVRQIFVSNLASMEAIAMKVLHKFSGGEDGQNPVGPLFAKGDALYGIATGGKYKAGVVFRMAPDGSDYGILHTFVGGKAHPSEPSSLVAGPEDWLYGVCKMPRPDASSNDKAILFRIKTDGGAFEMVPMDNMEQPMQHGMDLYYADEKGNMYGIVGEYHKHTHEIFGDLLRISTDGNQELSRIDGKKLSPFYAVGDFFYGVAREKESRADSIYRIRPDGTDPKILHVFGGAPLDLDSAERPEVLIGGKLFGKGRSGSKDVMYELPAEGGEIKLYPFESRSVFAIALFTGPGGQLLAAMPIDSNGMQYELARLDQGQWKQMKTLATGGWITTMQMLGNSEVAGTVSRFTYGPGSLISVALAAESAPGVARRK